MTKKNETLSIGENQLQENPQNQTTNPPQMPMRSQASNPLESAKLTDSASVPSVISADSIKAANARLVEAGEIRQKRKYTKRGTSGAVAASPHVSATSTAIQLPVDLTEAKFLLNLPFDALATATDFEEFKLSKDKLEQCAPLMHKVLQKYMPAMEGEHSALWALSFALVSHAGMAGWAYYQKLQLEQKDRDAKSETTSD